jgi:hypothetical protein
LAGYCVGGFVALEMARQLHAQGEPVALLALIDTYNPSNGSPSLHCVLAQRIRHFRQRAGLLREALAPKSLVESLRYLGGRLRAFLRETRFRAGYCLLRVLTACRQPIPSSLRGVRCASSLSLTRYPPKPYAGSAILLRVQDLRPEVEQMGWSGLILGGIEILDSPYHNLGLQAEAIAGVMAEQLRARLK